MAGEGVGGYDIGGIATVLLPVIGSFWWGIRTLLKVDGAVKHLDHEMTDHKSETESRFLENERTQQDRHVQNRNDMDSMTSSVNSLRTSQASMTESMAWVREALREIKEAIKQGQSQNQGPQRHRNSDAS